MREKSILLAASAIFLAFTGLSPADLDSENSVSIHRSDFPAGAVHLGTQLDAETEAVSDIETAPHLAAVDNALAKLGHKVVQRSHPEALRYAFEAYFNFREAQPESVRNPYFYFVDFGLDSRTPRGYVFDMESLTVVEGPFAVAHGRGSVVGGSSTPTRFLNTRGSNATSLGLYLAQETYDFRGRSGGKPYSSVGLRLRGLSGRFNSEARARGIVVHGAPYVTATGAGRSEGCPAMEQRLARKLIPMIANGGLVFHFSPADTRWMQEEPWVNTGPSRFAAEQGTVGNPAS